MSKILFYSNRVMFYLGLGMIIGGVPLGMLIHFPRSGLTIAMVGFAMAGFFGDMVRDQYGHTYSFEEYKRIWRS